MQPKIAFVYDWFDTPLGGAERVLQEFHKLYPDAPWYTSHIDPQATEWAKDWDVRTSFLQHFPRWFRRNRLLSLLLIPFAFESFDMSSYDVVISVSSAFAKGVVTQTHTKHICYLLTPARWLYNFQFSSFAGQAIFNFQIFRWIESRLRVYLQGWDNGAAQRVDEFISISQEVAQRCTEYYGRESEVVYPPFEYEKWENINSKSETLNTKSLDSAFNIQHSALIHFPYYLVVSRLEPYKRVDVAIEAFSISNERNEEPKRKLIIVGSGSQKTRLKALSRTLHIADRILWVDGLSDEKLARLYAHCKAFIMPQEEDFGYVACEAVACGAPIVAYAHGGQTEILADYPLKILCEAQSPGVFAQALEKIGDIRYNAQTYENSHICRGSRDAFVAAFSQKITQTV